MNMVIEKTIENSRKRVDIKLVSTSEEDKFRRLIASPAFTQTSIFGDYLAGIQTNESRLVLNWVIYFRMSILDLLMHLV